MRNLRVLNTRLARVDEEVKAHFSCDLEHHVYLISKDNTLYVWNLESNEVSNPTRAHLRLSFLVLILFSI